jgi:hypothetical protein
VKLLLGVSIFLQCHVKEMEAPVTATETISFVNIPLQLISLRPPCGIVVRVPGYGSRGSVSIPGATRFSEK